jgi:hypothetical protein
VATHSHAHGSIITQKELVIVGTHLRASSDPVKKNSASTKCEMVFTENCRCFSRKGTHLVKPQRLSLRVNEVNFVALKYWGRMILANRFFLQMMKPLP